MSAERLIRNATLERKIIGRKKSKWQKKRTAFIPFASRLSVRLDIQLKRAPLLSSAARFIQSLFVFCSFILFARPFYSCFYFFFFFFSARESFHRYFQRRRFESNRSRCSYCFPARRESYANVDEFCASNFQRLFPSSIKIVVSFTLISAFPWKINTRFRHCVAQQPKSSEIGRRIAFNTRKKLITSANYRKIASIFVSSRDSS